MCYSNSPEVADGERGTFFDYGNDDYWSLPGAPLPWWTVDENRFLCPDASCNVIAGGSPDPATPPVTPTVTPASADPAGNPPPPRGHARLKARRYHHGLWRVRLRASGKGRAVVVVR